MVTTRRQFVGACTAAIGAAMLPHRARALAPRSTTAHSTTAHPTPRPGVTGAKVLTAAQLEKSPYLVPLFDAVREIPEIVDGIRCQCGCASMPGYYSLLSCFEGDAMARSCPICQGEGRLVARLHKEGKTLDEIRAAVDAKYG
jgi:hypothetical protein